MKKLIVVGGYGLISAELVHQLTARDIAVLDQQCSKDDNPRVFEITPAYSELDDVNIKAALTPSDAWYRQFAGRKGKYPRF